MATTRLTQRLVPAVALLLACAGGDLVLPADGVPASIEVVEGGGQSGRVGVPLALPVVGQVTDAQGRPVAEVRVAFAFTDDGTAASVAPDTATTDADGRVTFQVVMGSRVGRTGAELRVAGASALVAPVSFTAVSADANELRAVGGDEQSGPAGTVLPEPLVVQVTDAFGNPIAGVPIAWTTDGGGSVSAAATQTGADGLASVVRTLGGGAGVQQAFASSPGLAGSPVTFSHRASAGAATVLEAVSGTGQSAVVGTALPQPLVVRARDEGGNPVPGLAVAWVVGDGGGSLTPLTSLTDQDGLASTQWTLGAAPGANGATAVVSGVGTVGFAATAVPGTPPGLSLETRPPTSAVRGVVLSPPPLVQLREPDGSPRRLAGVAVRVSIAEGGATLRGTAVRATDAAGRVEFRDLALLGVPGAYTLAFSATGYTGVASAPISLARAPTTTSIRSDDPDPSVVGGPVLIRYRVESAGGTPTGLVRVVSDDGVTCSATVAQGECSLSFTAAGVRTLTATYAGDTQFEGSSTTATHQVDAPAQPVLALATQPSATATAGQPFGRQPVVQLRDAQGADLRTAGVSVRVEIASGAGTLVGVATQITGQDGRAGFTGLAIAGAPGSFTLRFSADGYVPVVSETIAVGPAGPAATTTTITADDPDPSDVGQAVTVRFAVSAAAGTPTGTVTVAASAAESCIAAVAAGACVGHADTARGPDADGDVRRRRRLRRQRRHGCPHGAIAAGRAERDDVECGGSGRDTRAGPADRRRRHGARRGRQRAGERDRRALGDGLGQRHHPGLRRHRQEGQGRVRFQLDGGGHQDADRGGGRRDHRAAADRDRRAGRDPDAHHVRRARPVGTGGGGHGDVHRHQRRGYAGRRRHRCLERGRESAPPPSRPAAAISCRPAAARRP